MPYIAFAFTDAALDALADLAPKVRSQVIKKAKALHTNPHPPTSKKLRNVETPDGDAVYRERSGDYRILYLVRSNPAEIVILDIDHRKDVYRMPKTNPKAADEMRMKESDFDEMMKGAFGAPPPDEDAKATKEKQSSLSPYPRKRKKAGA